MVLLFCHPSVAVVLSATVPKLRRATVLAATLHSCRDMIDCFCRKNNNNDGEMQTEESKILDRFGGKIDDVCS